MIKNMSRCSDEILIHRHIEEHIKMQIVSCQYFSRVGRIREDLPEINVETQTLLLVTSSVKYVCKVKTLRSFRKRDQSDSKFENNLLEWLPSKAVICYDKMKNYTK